MEVGASKYKFWEGHSITSGIYHSPFSVWCCPLAGTVATSNSRLIFIYKRNRACLSPLLPSKSQDSMWSAQTGSCAHRWTNHCVLIGQACAIQVVGDQVTHVSTGPKRRGGSVHQRKSNALSNRRIGCWEAKQLMSTTQLEYNHIQTYFPQKKYGQKHGELRPLPTWDIITLKYIFQKKKKKYELGEAHMLTGYPNASSRALPEARPCDFSHRCFCYFAHLIQTLPVQPHGPPLKIKFPNGHVSSREN